MRSRLTTARLVLAVVSTSLEEAAIWVIWGFLLPDFDIHLPVGALVGIMVAWGAFSIWLFVFTTRALNKQAAVGLPSMVGASGRVASRLSPEGLARIRGELWNATSSEGAIEVGEEVLVVGERGLKLVVKRAGPTTR
jgi:membrane-bound serine protease (ClpP class)